MARIKSRSRAAAAMRAAASAKRARANPARAAAAAKPAHHAKPPRAPSAVNSRTPVAGREPAIAQKVPPLAHLDLPPPAATSSQSAPAAAPLPEPSLWQEMSQPLIRRIARRKRALANRATLQLARMRLAARRTQRHGARAWEHRLEQLQIVQHELRRRGRDLGLSARHRLRWIRADILGFIAAPGREAQLRPLRAAHVALRRTIASPLADAGRTLERILLTAARQFRPPPRDALAGALAALAVAIVSIAWLAVYSILAPTRDARPRVAPAPAAPAKEFTERATTPAPAKIELPAAEAPASPPAEVRHDATPAPAAVQPQAAPPAPAVRRAEPAAPKHKAAPILTKRKAAPQVHQRRARAARPHAPRSSVTAGRQIAPVN